MSKGFNKKIKLIFLRLFYVIPMCRTFSDWIIPLLIGGIIAIITYVMSANLLLTIIISIFAILLTRHVQQVVFVNNFNHSLRAFFKYVDKNHPVIQRFADSLLTRFIEDDNYVDMSNTLFHSSGPRNLKSLIFMLESDGATLMPELYSVLLAHASEQLPSKLIATWDTTDLPLATNPYQGYFFILEKVYSYMPSKNKLRIFIFSDKKEFERQTSGSDWDDVIKCHRNKFGFSKVYYCYKDYFDEFRSRYPNANKDLYDFVIYKTNFILKSQWIIGQQDNNRKTHMISNKRIVKETEEFIKKLVDDLEEKKYFIELKKTFDGSKIQPFRLSSY